MRYICFEGDGDGTPKTYTEEEFNTHMAGLRRKYETQEQQLKQSQKEQATQLEKLRQVKGLSDEERTDLETKIKDLESKYMTDQEKSERKAKEEREKYTQQVTQLEGDKNNWKKRYESATVRNEITRAAERHEAFKSTQIEAIVSPLVVFQEVKNDDDESTGEFKPIVKFPDIDSKTKQPIVMDYSIDEAVERMRELDDFSNLFKDKMKSGLGGTKNQKTGKKVDIGELAKTNPAEYRRLRKEQPELFRAG
jgi:hypothetical protein